MTTFLDVLTSSRILLMDGAMGTELQRSGLGPGQCAEAWNLTHPEAVRAIHRAYVQAGAECLLTNTFQANEAALARHGLDDSLTKIIQSALRLAREATGAERFVIGDIGPLEHPCPESAQLLIGAFETADALLLETWSDVAAAELFLRAARSRLGAEKPVLVSFTFQRAARHGSFFTFKGYPPEACAMVARDNGTAALGVNCGKDVDMEDMAAILRRYRGVTNLPLFARPNAGTPTRDGDGWVYSRQPEDMTAHLPSLLDAGATMVGGCCGTTPQTIAAFRAHFRGEQGV
jgi:5-methyltetrahydrofolate--homocysteine methyltransferase